MNQVPPVPCSLADMLNDLEWLKVGFAAAQTFATQREALDWARTKGIAMHHPYQHCQWQYLHHAPEGVRHQEGQGG